jgi:hypothetical protein
MQYEGCYPKPPREVRTVHTLPFRDTTPDTTESDLNNLPLTRKQRICAYAAGLFLLALLVVADSFPAWL